MSIFTTKNTIETIQQDKGYHHLKQWVAIYIYVCMLWQGVEFTALVTAVDWLREEIAQRGRNMGFTGSSHHTIQHAAKLLGETLVSAYKPDGQPW